VRRGWPWAAVTALAITVVVAAPASAGVDAWTAGDEPGGVISSLAFAGTAALGGSDAGLYRSSDGGASWTRIGAFDYRRVAAVAIDPAAGQPLYAATTTGMFRSLDQGTTWASITGAVTVDASFSGVVADSGAPGTALFLTGDKVYRSTTGGAGIWTNVSAGLPFGLDGAIIDPQTHNAWGWSYGDGVFVLPSGAATWSAASVGLPSTSVDGLALDTSGTRRLIAATVAGMATLPAAGGPSWSALNTGLTGAPTPYAIALGYDAAGNGYVTLLNGTLWRLAPGATTWAQLRAPPSSVTSPWVGASSR
jgi:photosystem II stability/assembly factor-like uncharacterized protein